MGVGDEYEVIPLRPSWGGLSLLFFLAALLARPLLQALFGSPFRAFPGPAVFFLSVPVLGLLGVLCAVIGLRLSRVKTVARLGLMLNGAIVLITSTLIAVFMIGRYLR